MRLMINVLRLSLLRDSRRSLSEGLTLMISAWSTVLTLN